MSGFNFSSIISAMNSAGLASSIPSVISSIAGSSSTSSKINALLNQLVQDAASPTAAAAVVTQIESTPGCPAGVVSALETIRNGGFQQLAIIEAIPGIEAAVSAANSIF
jgi:hypothetical protein